MAAWISPDSRAQLAAHDRLVNFFNLPSGELCRKREVGLVVFGDDEAAAGVLVEPVHDAGPGHAADAAERPLAMVEQGVDERMFLVAGGGMHDQPGGFVQNQQGFVLEQDVERNFLRLRLGGPGFRPVNLNLFPGARAVRGFDPPAVDADMALFNQPLQGPARGGGKLSTQESVEPSGRQRLLDGESFRARGHFPQRDRGQATGDGKFRADGGWKWLMLLVTGHGFWRVLGFPGDDENQSDAGADGGVGDIEGGKTNDRRRRVVAGRNRGNPRRHGARAAGGR